MSVQEVPYYYLTCDCCGERADYGDYSAWSDPGDAVSYADPDFQEVDGQYLCPSCWCWPEDLPDYPGDAEWTGGDDPVRKHAEHAAPNRTIRHEEAN